MVFKCRRYVSQSFAQRSAVAMLYVTLGDVFEGLGWLTMRQLCVSPEVLQVEQSPPTHAWAIRALSHTAEHPS